MIKYKKIVDNANCNGTFIEEVQTYNIITSKMNDAFIPCRINENCMMWATKEGVLGELECIFPQKKFILPKYIDKDIESFDGLPLVKGEFTNSFTEVYVGDERFVLIFDNSELASVKYKKDNVCIYASNQLIVAIDCKIKGLK